METTLDFFDVSKACWTRIRRRCSGEPEAVGRIDFVPGERVSEGDGEAFRLSGRLLQDSAPGQRMRFASSDRPDARLWDIAFGLVDAIISRSWSAKQARAVSGALRGWPAPKTACLWTLELQNQQ